MRHPGRVVTALALAVAVYLGVGARVGVIPTGELRADLRRAVAEVEAQLSGGDGTAGEAPAPSADATDAEHGFSYSCLSGAQRSLYDELYAGVMAREATFSVGSTSTDDLKQAMRALLEDHPELFWLDGSATLRTGALGMGATVTPGLDLPLDQVDSVQAQVEAAADSWVASLPAGATTYDKVCSAYEWVINNTDYDETSEQNQNIQSVFLGHRSVCAGYAKAFQYLLRRVGIPCAYVTGQIEAGAHAWDLVEIDGTYTYVDPTWGDPTYLTQQGVKQDGNVSHDYLCLTTEEMERDHHAADRASQLPQCTSTDYDWYRLRGTYLTSVDSQAIADAFWDAVSAGEREVGYKFADDATYAEAAALLASNGFLQNSLAEYGRTHGMSQVSYSYATSPELRVVKVFW